MTLLSLSLVLFFAAISLAVDPKDMIDPLGAKLDIDTIDLDALQCRYRDCDNAGPPICAHRKGKLVLFPTMCALESFECVTGKTWETVELKVCAKKICPVDCHANQEFSVCAYKGSKFRTFKSECKFRNHACKNYHEPWYREPSC